MGQSETVLADECTVPYNVLWLDINIQMGQSETVLADECTVPYNVLWLDILHYRHLSNCGNASYSNDSRHQRLWQVKTYFQYAE
jgi:hypothetical protein